MSKQEDNSLNQEQPSSNPQDAIKAQQNLDKLLYKLTKENGILKFKIESLNQKLSDIVHNKHLEEINKSKAQAKYIVSEESKDDKVQ